MFSSFYKIAQYPQVPGLGSFLSGRTWEKGGYIAHLRAIEDDDGRAMVLINWNTDIGDGLEWSNAEQFPGYLIHTATAYRIMINLPELGRPRHDSSVSSGQARSAVA